MIGRQYPLASCALAMALCAFATAGAAMAIDDLTRVDTAKLEADGWSARKEAARLTLACGTCEGFSAADILLDTVTDGTEERIRAGTTTAQTMLDICRKNAEASGTECFGLERADVGGAVGFVSDVGLGAMGFAATHILWQDGQRLTVRSLAPTREEAARISRLMADTVVPQIAR